MIDYKLQYMQLCAMRNVICTEEGYKKWLETVKDELEKQGERYIANDIKSIEEIQSKEINTNVN